MKKLFLLLAVTIAFALNMAAQNRTVSGQVVGADDGEPIVGATVMGVGSKIGVTTDIDGNFSLSLPQSVKKLSVSYVGMKTQEAAITPGKMTIVLESSNMLDEVISVAYGTQKRSSFTGSASVLDASKIEGVQVSNPVDALNGRVAGVQLNNISGQPGSSNPSIYIRGISSVNAGNEPLIVLDGTPFSGDLNTISNQDIESMTVLKDAASNALYGARGANGVILITTKKGKGTAKVTLDAKWGSNSRAVSDYDVIDDPWTYYSAYATATANSRLESYGGTMTPDQALKYVNGRIMNYMIYPIFNVPEEENLIVLDNGRYVVNPNATLGNVVKNGDQEYYLTADNWKDAAFRHSLRQEYNLSVSQATDRGSFYFSGSYLNNEGITANSNYERFTGRLSADIQANSWLKVGANMQFAHYNAKQLSDQGQPSVGNLFYVANSMAPVYPLYVRDGNGVVMTDDYGNTMYDYGNEMNAGLRRPNMPDANPIGSNILDVNKSNGNSFFGNAFAEIRFLRDFKFTTNNSVALDETRMNSVTNPFYGGYADFNGMVTVEHMRTIDWTFQQLLNWTRSFGRHNINILLGHENYVTKDYVLWGSAQNMLLPSNIELSGAIVKTNDGSSRGMYNNEGWFSRANYDFEGKYFASASFRRDASSRFHPDHRWGNFWSASAAWIISKEAFFHAPWVDMLKIKASYGEQGNDRIGNYRYTNTYTIINSDGQPAAQPGTVMGNPDITWEKGGTFNAGVDFSLFNERLGGTIEGFWRKTSDMLFTRPLPPTFGYRSQYANVGDMVNRGIEIDLHGDVYRTKDVTIGLTLNLTHYRNEITRLIESSKREVVDGSKGYSSGDYYYGEGESIYTFCLPTYVGIDKETGMPMYLWNTEDEAGNPIVSTTTDYSKLDKDNGDYHLHGTVLPDVYGGFGIYGNAYGFDFSVDFNYSIGGKIYDGTYAALMGSPTSSNIPALHKDLLNAWTPEQPNSSVPRFVYGDENMSRSSSRFLTDASYLSLQGINVGYTIPQKWTRKFQVDRIRIYFTADNVALWSKRKGLDPRLAMAQGLSSSGAKEQAVSGSSSNSYYSPIRTLSGGINVTF